jgi:RecA/RadA recombinase
MSDHKIERVKTGIPGLDELIEGGFPRGNWKEHSCYAVHLQGCH